MQQIKQVKVRSGARKLDSETLKFPWNLEIDFCLCLPVGGPILGSDTFDKETFQDKKISTK